MRYPPASAEGHVVWSHWGTVVGVWRVCEPLSYLHLSDSEKTSWMHTIRQAFASAESSFTVLSVCEPTDPELIAGLVSARSGADMTEGWSTYARERVEELNLAGTWQRRFYIVAEIAAASRQTIVARLSAQAGFVPRPPSARHRQKMLQLADRWENRWNNSGLRIEAVKERELRWLYVRAAYRSVTAVTRTAVADTSATAAPLVNAAFVEGGVRSDPDRPRHRRYLRVETESGVSYQSFLCASRMPLKWSFPGQAEWWFQAHRFPFSVDWAARVTPIANREALKKARKQVRSLEEQQIEWADRPDKPLSLGRGLQGASDLSHELSESGHPQLRIVMTFCVSADSCEHLETYCDQFRSHYETAEWSMPRPTGKQAALFQHMLPGGPVPGVLRSYTQFFLPESAAVGMPFAECDVGDPQGHILGYSTDAWSNKPVLFDASHGPAKNMSGSLAAFGTLGSGKSFAIKQIAYATVHRGGRVVCVDRTHAGEYVQFSRAFGESKQAQVVTVSSEGGMSLDPMRVFAEDRVRHTVGLLSQLASVSVRGYQTVVLEQACHRVAAAGGSAADVLDELKNVAAGADGREEAAAANEMWLRLSMIAADPLAGIVFDRSRPPLKLSGHWIVFSLAGLDLPDQDQLTGSDVGNEPTREQTIGQGLLYLLAAVCRQFCMADTGVFTAALIDEAWAFTAHPGARNLISALIRDGRKHNAALWFLSQNPNDIRDDAAATQIGYRLLFRQGEGAGADALRFLGIKEPRADQVRMVEGELGQGTCLMRDLYGRVGTVKILPVDAASYAAADTRPETVLAE